MTPALPIQTVDGEPVIDSRIVAWECGVQPGSVYRLLLTWLAEIERECGTVRFEIQPSTARGAGGDGVRHALLNELQATALITLMRNTLPVVRFKIRLAKAFFEVRRAIRRLTSVPRPNRGTFPRIYDPAQLAGRLGLPKTSGELRRFISSKLGCSRNTSYRIMAKLVDCGQIAKRPGITRPVYVAVGGAS